MMQIIIDNLERDATTGGVKTVHWRLNKTAGQNVATAYGSFNCEPNPQDPGFIPFGQLTEVQVQGWVRQHLGVEAMAAYEASLDAQLADLQAPATLNGTPWGN